MHTLDMSHMMLSVGKKNVPLPPGYCDVDRIQAAVTRMNPPFTVHPKPGKSFSVKGRVFFSVDGLSVECENEKELHFACKLASLDHNRWQTCDNENLQNTLAETELMEAEARERMRAPLKEEDFLPEEILKEDEDITLDEWSQMGYKWFTRQEAVYL